MVRRWNGWGEEEIDYPLSESAIGFLRESIKGNEKSADASLFDVLKKVPPSGLPAHPLIITEAEERLRHARGQSLPDWIELRSGDIRTFPEGVAFPSTAGEVQDLIKFAYQLEANLIPYGGGTSVVGHINPPSAGRLNITLDISQINEFINLDKTSHLATFGAGIRGLDLESKLRAQGFTLGHFPQSLEYSTLGGWIATRSCGQQSYHYGRMDDLFVGGHLETPVGPIDLPVFPASAAGPDLRQVILGSEGRYGIITQATVRVRRLPQAEGFYAIIFPHWETGVQAVREIAQSGLPISMLRLSDADETITTFMLSGRDRLVPWAERGLRLLGYRRDRCLLIFGVSGERRVTGKVRDNVVSLARRHRGLYTGTLIGRQWRKSRFLTPYLRNTLWDLGYALDTLETAVPWRKVQNTTADLKVAIQETIQSMGQQALVIAHLSHVYQDGASIYITYIFGRASDPQETLHRWKSMKSAASQVIIDQGGTISHQHGVGRDHREYLEAEKGKLGLKALSGIRRTLDPKGLLNPGSLINEQ